MTIKDFIDRVDCQILNIAEESRKITTGYAGDLLSFVMGRAPSSCVWFTVMTNINICAVATLADISLIVVCENCDVDSAVLEKAKIQKINIVKTKLDMFSAIKVFNESKV